LEFLLHPLRRKTREMGSAAFDGPPRSRIDHKPEAGRESYAPQRAKAVFAHPRLRFANRAHEPSRQIPAPAKRIVQHLELRRVRDSVDREIPTRQILIE